MTIWGECSAIAYTYDDTIEQTFPADGSLRIVSDRGAINGSAERWRFSIKVVVHKKLYANNQSDADKYNQGSKPIVTVNGTSVLLNANTNGAGDHGVSTDMDVYVPRKAALDVASRRGDLNITDRKADVKISGQRGDVALNDITGAVKINLEKGSVRVSNVTGDVDIDGRIDDASIDDVNGAVSIERRLLRQHSRVEDREDGHLQVDAFGHYAGVGSRRSGNLRRLTARDRHDRPVAAGAALERGVIWTTSAAIWNWSQATAILRSMPRISCRWVT